MKPPRHPLAFACLLILLAITTSAQNLDIIFADHDGSKPEAELVLGSDGAFYGTTREGGSDDLGTIFRMVPGTSPITIHSFNGINGSSPYAGLVEGSDGSLYGTTNGGGANNAGTVFKITKEGLHTLMYSFVRGTGASPKARLVLGGDGALYGTTAGGGRDNYGTVFKITTGGTHTVLHHFADSIGAYPMAPLVQGDDGAFYGTTKAGGAGGTIFRITSSGAHTVLRTLGGAYGAYPECGMVLGHDGALYGTTPSGGGHGDSGAVFKITSSGIYTLVHSFDKYEAIANGFHPLAGLVQGMDGSLYGTTVFGGVSGYGTVFKITPDGMLTTLHSFEHPERGHPRASLLLAHDGAIYGTTSGIRSGAIFKINPDGMHVVLHRFNSGGVRPRGGLVMDSKGALYGTTEEGGGSNDGTVFKISASGARTVLHSFSGFDGKFPRSRLVRGGDGAFYGTTASGGANGAGTVFKITTDGEHTVLHSFTGDSSGPWAALVLGGDGAFYGTTFAGGAKDQGTVFRITSSGEHTRLHSFSGSNGRYPSAELVLGKDGALYGTTTEGGARNLGTVFRITPAGAHKVLLSFSGGNGSYPVDELVLGSDDAFYGTTTGGGSYDTGTCFRITAKGGHRVLYHFFTDDRDSFPASGLVHGGDGVFFGITARGGEHDAGSLFKITSGGAYTLLRSFDKGQGDFPQGSLLLDSDGRLYGTADPMVIWSMLVPPSPEIALSGNGQDIVQGDGTPDALDHTHFGSVQLGANPVVRTFSITNTGTADLTLVGSPRVTLTGSPAFSVTQQPSSDTLTAGGVSQTFQIQFAPSAVRVHTAVVSIDNNDDTENPFTFTVAGVGMAPDTKNPTLKLISPAGKVISATLPYVVRGIAGDTYAVDRVEVTFNGAEAALAQWDEGSKPTDVRFSAEIIPLIGENSLTVTVYDTSGNSTAITRGFTFEQRYRMTVGRAVPAALETMPDKAGTVQVKAVSAQNASPLTKANPAISQVLPNTMLTLTATAKTGCLFSHWNGLPEGAQVRGNVLSFQMSAKDVEITAVFLDNPLIQGVMALLGPKPIFHGLLRPAETTTIGNDTVGFLSAMLVPSKGSLSGKLWMDGVVAAFTGALHADGSVWFMVGKELTSVLPFAGRELTMTWDESGLAMSVIRQVDEVDQVSEGQAKPPLYSKAVPVRDALLDAKGKHGYYTVALPAMEQIPLKPDADYPQGAGHAGLTLLSNGTLKLAGTLAEGTKITAAAYLAEGDEAEVFIVLPTPGGKLKASSLLGTLVFDEAQTDSDVNSPDLVWFRPQAQTQAAKVQAYRAGWPEGLVLGLMGAKYDKAATAQTTLGFSAGNAGLLSFAEGKLVAEVEVSNFTVSGNTAVKTPSTDKSYTLSFTQSTGLMKGTFTPNWESPAAKLPGFTGVLLSKGANQGGWGFFLSNRAGDLDPESGAVTLGQP